MTTPKRYSKMEIKKITRFCLILLFVQLIGSFFLQSSYATEKEYIIGFHNHIDIEKKRLILNSKENIKREYRYINAFLIKLSETALPEFLSDPETAYIEENLPIYKLDEYSDSWGIGHIKAETAHSNGILGDGVKVAILDTGIDYNHEDLRENYKGGYDFVFDDSDPFDDSYDSHGTHVAGIIGASRNGIGIVGVAPKAWIYAIKVLDGSGFGLLSDLLAGIEWAIDNGMNIKYNKHKQRYRSLLPGP